MNKVRELKIDSTLWATPAKIINLLDFKPEKLSVETKSNTNNDIKLHQVRYENGVFYLTIDNIRGYFNFSNNLGILTMIFDNDDQKNKYQIWRGILKIINKENGELRLHEKIKIIDSDLPIEHVFKIPSITIVIKSLIEKNNKFYLELSLNHCLYGIKSKISVYITYKTMISINIKDPLFTSNNGQLVNIFDFNPKKLSIKKVTDAVSDDPEYIYVKYDNNFFYLVIDDLKGYFKYYKEKDNKVL